MAMVLKEIRDTDCGFADYLRLEADCVEIPLTEASFKRWLAGAGSYTKHVFNGELYTITTYILEA